MRKKWVMVPIILIIIFALWQAGAINYLLARTIFAPNYAPGFLEEEREEPGQAEPPAHEEEPLFSPGALAYETEIIGEGLDIPWEIAPLPDGRFLVTERPGRVVMLEKGEIYSVYDAVHIGEGGLLGIELSPNFQDDRQIFLYYTYKEGSQIWNRVSRFTFEEDTFKNETYILDKIPGARFHNGGRLKFGPDKKLYITTGDARDSNLSQDIHSLAGKILRINADGTIPSDNPFENSPVYAYGLRNPQGLAWHPVHGDLYASDHGPDSQDEVNRIIAGNNYGWPVVTCLDGDTAYEEPIACYTDFTLAPSGIDFLPGKNLDETPLYVAGLRGNMLMRIDLDGAGHPVTQESLFNDYGRIRTVVYHEGSLYIATNNRDGRGIPGEADDIIIKITPILP